MEDKFEWSSDDDNVLSTEDTVDGHYRVRYMFFLGFHPYKEDCLPGCRFEESGGISLEYLKFQDLGNICPGDYGMIGEIETSFIYTPCWMDGGFPVEQKKSTTAN